MQGPANPPSRGIYSLLVIVVLAWGLSWPANKAGLTFIPPLWFASLRLLYATVVMFALAAYIKKLIVPTLKDLPMIFSLGVFQIGLFILFINLGLDVQQSGTSAILVYTTPLWVMPMAIFFFKEFNSTLKWVGFTLGLIGVVIMLNPWEMDWTNTRTVVGAIFLMGASVSFSISILCARYMTWHHTPIELVSWQLLVGSVMVLIVALVLQPHPDLQLNLTSITTLSYTAVVATAFGFFGMSKLSKELPSTLTSISFLGVPVSGVIFSVILLHEPLDLHMVIAMLFITCGLVCVVLGEKKKASKSK
ncbi:MAG: hypothetical protein A3J38_07175 [Gammaproteobacteria bacterium RIFCSPHIGHO2_12_FULL_45_9]|nr:MAG: hypothetical protein A3J38_07175 [Gammaproteobacteria bacterium RIFCSPHIGHO2_12_FULL_45_9]